MVELSKDTIESARRARFSPFAGRQPSSIMRFVSLLCLALVFGFGVRSVAFAQSHAQGVTQLESRVTKLERKIAKIGNDKGPVLFLFGVFCALWAQNTGRNA